MLLVFFCTYSSWGWAWECRSTMICTHRTIPVSRHLTNLMNLPRLAVMTDISTAAGPTSNPRVRIPPLCCACSAGWSWVHTPHVRFAIHGKYQKEPPDYDLIATANHHGSVHGGHYT